MIQQHLWAFELRSRFPNSQILYKDYPNIVLLS